MKRQQIVVDNKTYEVLATIYDEETDKDYCVFTDLNQDKNKGLKLSCVEYYEEKGELIPVRITDSREKEVAAELIKEVIEKMYRIIGKK